jgi:hypothetical protein
MHKVSRTILHKRQMGPRKGEVFAKSATAGQRQAWFSLLWSLRLPGRWQSASPSVAKWQTPVNQHFFFCPILASGFGFILNLGLQKMKPKLYNCQWWWGGEPVAGESWPESLWILQPSRGGGRSQTHWTGQEMETGMTGSHQCKTCSLLHL